MHDFYSSVEIDGTVDHETLERQFSSEIEHESAPILRRITERKKIDRSLKEPLCRFVQSMYSRVPKGHERLRDQAPKIADQVHLNALQRIAPDLSEEKRQELVDAAGQISDFFAANPPKDAMLPRANSRVIKHLMQMRFAFAEVAQGFQFITSDAPLAFDPSWGVSKSDFSLPLSTDIALVGTHSRAISDLDYHSIPAQIARNINQRTFANAQRFAFSRSKQAWMSKAVRQRKHIGKTVGWPK